MGLGILVIAVIIAFAGMFEVYKIGSKLDRIMWKVFVTTGFIGVVVALIGLCKIIC